MKPTKRWESTRRRYARARWKQVLLGHERKRKKERKKYKGTGGIHDPGETAASSVAIGVT